MLTKSGRDIPREQNDGCVAVTPADAAPVTAGVTDPPSAGLLAISRTNEHSYDNARKIRIHLN